MWEHETGGWGRRGCIGLSDPTLLMRERRADAAGRAFGERMIFYGDEYMHIRPVHCGQPMGPIWVGPIWVGPMPLQSQRGPV